MKKIIIFDTENVESNAYIGVKHLTKEDIIDLPLTTNSHISNN